jgi:hypothetical protein
MATMKKSSVWPLRGGIAALAFVRPPQARQTGRHLKEIGGLRPM